MNQRALLEEPAAGNLHGGVCEGGDIPGHATVDLNGHEAGNGGHSQGKPTASRILLYSERHDLTPTCATHRAYNTAITLSSLYFFGCETLSGRVAT